MAACVLRLCGWHRHVPAVSCPLLRVWKFLPALRHRSETMAAFEPYETGSTWLGS